MRIPLVRVPGELVFTTHCSQRAAPLPRKGESSGKAKGLPPDQP